MKTEEIPISDVKVINRLRKIDEGKVEEIAQSIAICNILHPIHVAQQGGGYILLSGGHRLCAMKLLNRTTIPAVVRPHDTLINQLVEVSENLCSKRLNAIQEAQHIVLREEILVKLGKKAVVGSNQYTGNAITNAQLANQLGISRRIYSYKKQIANIHPEVQELIGEHKSSSNMMDMVKLSKQTYEIQKEIATLLSSGEVSTFNRAFILANLKFKQKDWNAEYAKIRDELDTPKSVMKFSRKQDHLNDICIAVSSNVELKRKKKTALFGTNEISNYRMLPEHSRWFIKYFSNEGDLCCDNTCGLGTNVLAAAYEGRRVIGYDLSEDNISNIRTALVDHIGLTPDKFTLHHSCGVEMDEYKEASDMVDLFINDIPYIGAEKYTDDPRDLCNVKGLDQFYNRVEVMLRNMKRLVKPSSYENKIYKPIIMKVGSVRKQGKGLYNMQTDIELAARRVGLTLWDSITNELRPTFQSFILQKCIANKFTVKSHETSLVFCKFE